jgi:hypothetical protein
MLVYRSFVVGLLGACCLLLAERPRPEVRLIAPSPPPAVEPEAPAIVDVAAGIGPAALAQALHIPSGSPLLATGPGWSYSVSFLVQPDDLAPIFAEHKLEAGTYLDLMVAGRRVLVLVH